MLRGLVFFFPLSNNALIFSNCSLLMSLGYCFLLIPILLRKTEDYVQFLRQLHGEKTGAAHDRLPAKGVRGEWAHMRNRPDAKVRPDAYSPSAGGSSHRRSVRSVS